MSKWDSETIKARIAELTVDIESDPNDWRLFFNRGNAYRRLCVWESAIADYDKSLDLEPNNPEAHGGRGCVFVRKEDWRAAVKEFTESYKLRPAPIALVSRSMAYGALERNKEALVDLKRAMSMDKNDYHTHIAGGLYHQWKSELDKAVRYYDRCIVMDPDECMAYFYRAECLERMGGFQEAINSYQEYLLRQNPRAAKSVDDARRKIAMLEGHQD